MAVTVSGIVTLSVVFASVVVLEATIVIVFVN